MVLRNDVVTVVPAVPANGNGQTTDEPTLFVVYGRREYGPYPLSQVGERGLTLERLAVMTDADVRAVAEAHIDLPRGTLAGHQVVRTAAGSVVLSPKAEMGFKWGGWSGNSNSNKGGKRGATGGGRAGERLAFQQWCARNGRRGTFRDLQAWRYMQRRQGRNG